MVVSALVMHGYVVGTVRSSDSAAERSNIISQWNDPLSNLQVFVANIQTMSVGVNLHKACCKGIFLNWHLSAKAMLQMIGRLNRIGQTGHVSFHLLKTMGSYHDNIERLNIAKWMVQLSAECALPSWMEFELMEIVICESIKAAWLTPFNRYSWIVEREVSKSEIAYHSPHVVKMGHIFSMIARLLWTADEEEQRFWSENVNFLTEAVRTLSDNDSQYLRGVEQAEAWLALPIDKLRKKIIKIITELAKQARKRYEKDAKTLGRVNRQREAVKGRLRLKQAAENNEIAEAKGGSDVDSDEEMEQEESESEEELAEPAEAEGKGKKKGRPAPKRKALQEDEEGASPPETPTPAQKKRRVVFTDRVAQRNTTTEAPTGPAPAAGATRPNALEKRFGTRKSTRKKKQGRVGNA